MDKIEKINKTLHEITKPKSKCRKKECTVTRRHLMYLVNNYIDARIMCETASDSEPKDRIKALVKWKVRSKQLLLKYLKDNEREVINYDNRKDA